MGTFAEVEGEAEFFFAVESAIAPNHTQFIPVHSRGLSERISCVTLCEAGNEREQPCPATVSCTGDTVREPHCRRFGGEARPEARSSLRLL